MSADGVTHIDEHECGKLETKDFTSTGGDAALQYVRAFSNSDDFALTGLVVTQQVGENPWHFCPSSRAGAVSFTPSTRRLLDGVAMSVLTDRAVVHHERRRPTG